MKLTLISIVYRGIRYSKFVMANFVNGKAQVDNNIMENFYREIGILPHTTLTIGG